MEGPQRRGKGDAWYALYTEVHASDGGNDALSVNRPTSGELCRGLTVSTFARRINLNDHFYIITLVNYASTCLFCGFCPRFASYPRSLRLEVVPNGTDLKALYGLISEAELLLTATSLPKAHAKRAADVLRSARTIAEALVKNPPVAAKVRIGGVRAARRDRTHTREIAGNGKMRVPRRPLDLRGSVADMRRLVERVSREVAKLAAQRGA